MFERYTEKARRVIFFARYEASQFGSPYIETEHLLLGLLREDKALTNRFLRSHASVESVRKQVQGRTTVRQRVATSVDLPLSQECKHVLGFAAEEAARLSHQHIGTEHLLLGLLREEKSFAAEMLHERGLRLETIREDLARGPSEKTPSSPSPKASLLEFSRDLTQAAMANELDPLIGREDELERVIRALCRRTRNNPVLVGEPGVGKTAIVHGLAQRMAGGSVPRRLQSKRLIVLDLSPVAAATTGESAQLEQRIIAVLEEILNLSPPTAAAGAESAKLKERISGHLKDLSEGRILALLDEFKRAADVIIFIEDLFAKPGARGWLNTANLLKPLLTRGEVQCIATATPDDYRKAIAEEAWLGASFNVVEVRPPDEAEALTVLAGIKQRYEQFHGVTYTDEALQYAVRHSQRYIPDRFLPEKAIDLIDEAGAAEALRHASTLPQEVIDTQQRIKFVAHRMEVAIANHELEKARFYSEEERKERENLDQLREKYNLDATATVTLDDIEEAVARRTGIPIATIRQERGGAGPASQEGQPS